MLEPIIRTDKKEIKPQGIDFITQLWLNVRMKQAHSERIKGFWSIGKAAFAAGSLIAALVAGFGAGALTAAPEHPRQIVDCGDGKVAQENGDLIQAARAAGQEVGALPDTNYLAIGGALHEANLSPENPGGTVQPGQEVALYVGPSREVIAFHLGACGESFSVAGRE
jgi:hypothetical protein